MKMGTEPKREPVPGDHAGDSIPFNRPSLEGREAEYMRQAVEGGHTSAAGPFSAAAAGLLCDELGCADILLTTSCTAALEMAAMLLDIEPGDTVVVPSFGFVTTALAFVRQGARILFCDIERERLGLDPTHLDELMDETVRAVVPIHYAGVPCDLDPIRDVVSRWPRAELVEDNAHGLFGRHAGRPLGSFGRFAALSFHETKNFICGEGGAIVLNDQSDVARAHTVFHKGTNRREFMLGEVDKYSWQDVGSSFGLSDVLAAFLYGQLEQHDSIRARRRTVVRALPGAAVAGGRVVRVPAALRPAGRRAGPSHVLRAAPRSYDQGPRPDRHAGRRGARHLPLRSAAQLAGRCTVRGSADRMPDVGRHQRAAAAPALLHQHDVRGARAGRGRLPACGPAPSVTSEEPDQRFVVCGRAGISCPLAFAVRDARVRRRPRASPSAAPAPGPWTAE